MIEQRESRQKQGRCRDGVNRKEYNLHSRWLWSLSRRIQSHTRRPVARASAPASSAVAAALRRLMTTLLVK